jgi:hypothetical protein
MKNIIILSALLFVTINLSAQDSEPSPLLFTIKVNGDTMSNQAFSRDFFKQEEFFLGPQWEGHARMLQALHCNLNHGVRPQHGWSDSARIGFFPNNADSGYKLKYIWDGRKENYRGFQYSPTLYITESQRGQFIYQAADDRCSVFGFSYIRDSAQVINNPNSTIYKLYADSSDYIDSVVLGKTWINDKFYLIGNPGDEKFDSTTGGTRWIFSINLRRLNINESADDNDDIILSIKLPYVRRLTTTNTINGLIKFSYPPKNTLNDTVGLKYLEDRGFAMKIRDLPLISNDIYITNRMLPDSAFFANTGRQDITINAEFICSNPFLNNPLLIVRGDTIGIEKIDIEVTYHGNRDVGINYCRIATPAGYDYVTGKHDSLTRAYYQKQLDSIQNGGYEIYGIYGRDEFPEHYYMEQRYKAKLLNFPFFVTKPERE